MDAIQDVLGSPRCYCLLKTVARRSRGNAASVREQHHLQPCRQERAPRCAGPGRGATLASACAAHVLRPSCPSRSPGPSFCCPSIRHILIKFVHVKSHAHVSMLHLLSTCTEQARSSYARMLMRIVSEIRSSRSYRVNFCPN